MRHAALIAIGLVVGLGLISPAGACPPPVENLACEETSAGHQLSWENAFPYIFLEIERNGDIIGSLPGDATSFLDPAPPTGPHLYFVVAHDGASPSLTGCFLPPSEAFFSAPDLSTSSEQIRLPIQLTFPLEHAGLSFGFSHDPEKVTLLEVGVGAAVTELMGGGPGFFAAQLDSTSPSGETGFTVGMIYDLLGQTHFPPGKDMEIVSSALADPPGTGRRCNCSRNLGQPDLTLQRVVAGKLDGIQQATLLLAASLLHLLAFTLAPCPAFVRSGAGGHSEC